MRGTCSALTLVVVERCQHAVDRIDPTEVKPGRDHHPDIAFLMVGVPTLAPIVGLKQAAVHVRVVVLTVVARDGECFHQPVTAALFVGGELVPHRGRVSGQRQRLRGAVVGPAGDGSTAERLVAAGDHVTDLLEQPVDDRRAAAGLGGGVMIDDLGHVAHRLAGVEHTVSGILMTDDIGEKPLHQSLGNRRIDQLGVECGLRQCRLRHRNE